MPSSPLDPIGALFAPRATLNQLAALSQRLSTSLEAGIDIRKTLAREAELGRGAFGRMMREVSGRVNRGESFTKALNETGRYFPELFRGVAEVGELTGHQGEVFRQMTDHYRGQIQLRRQFLAAIAWPMIQLALALLVVGLMIWIMGWVQGVSGSKVDPLGFGLVGTSGLTIYVSFILSVAAIIAVLIHAARRGVFWIKPVQRWILRVPWLGGAIRTLALARLAWSMHLTFFSGMDLRKALQLSLRSARNAFYEDQIPPVDAAVVRGQSLYETFLQLPGYPADFLDTLAVGEQSGRIEESMATLSRQYQERARAALATITMLAGVAVWMIVAALIIMLIFRLFFFYLGALQQAAAPL